MGELQLLAPKRERPGTIVLVANTGSYSKLFTRSIVQMVWLLRNTVKSPSSIYENELDPCPKVGKHGFITAKAAGGLRTNNPWFTHHSPHCQSLSGYKAWKSPDDLF
jgi:hypothetical protein